MRSERIGNHPFAVRGIKEDYGVSDFRNAIRLFNELVKEGNPKWRARELAHARYPQAPLFATEV